MKNKINYKDTKYWRWFGFILAVIGAYILGNAQIISQWLGWTICSASCLIWIFNLAIIFINFDIFKVKILKFYLRNL